VLWGNIEDNKRLNFDRRLDDAEDIGPYDLESIVHYSCFAFSRNELSTLCILTPSITCNDLGDNVRLSDKDILSAYRMYPPIFEISGVTAGTTLPRSHSLYPSRHPRAPGTALVHPSANLRLGCVMSRRGKLQTAACRLEAHPFVVSVAERFAFRMPAAAEGQLGPLEHPLLPVEHKPGALGQVYHQRSVFAQTDFHAISVKPSA